MFRGLHCAMVRERWIGADCFNAYTDSNAYTNDHINGDTAIHGDST
ncbi:hypothetical protein [Methanoculleus sp.]|nr:hypothetical protein [Methanoculleus sp.]